MRRRFEREVALDRGRDTKVPSSLGQCAVCSNLSIEKSLKTESVKVLNEIYFSNVLWGIDAFNPNSHGVFFVSRLTAVGHMRHPFKADLGEI